MGAQLQSPDGRRILAAGCWRLLRTLNGLLCILYLLALIAIYLLMRCVGERNMFLAFCLYLPPLGWFVPALGLAFTSLCLLDWKSLVGLSVVCAAVAVFGVGWKISGAKRDPVGSTEAGGQSVVTVLTNNRGQDIGAHGESLKPFMNAIKPDVMAFQESPGMANRYKSDPGYSDYQHAADVGEFTLLSKYPILSSELVSLRPVDALPESWWPTIAARFVVQIGSRTVVIYNVHAPTPRGTLQYYSSRGAFLYGIIGLPGTPWAAKRREGEKGWLQRIEIVKALLERVRAEKEPTIVAGDFNMPSCGYLHALVAESISDCHAAAGRGFGFSFPGITRNPLALGGPWMRIDYLFGGSERVQCLWSKTEGRRRTQHVAVAAGLRVW